MSPLGLLASALICAKSSPVAFCVTLTLTPVAFSKPIANPWHQAEFGELQYIASVPCAPRAAAGASATTKTASRMIVVFVIASLWRRQRAGPAAVYAGDGDNDAGVADASESSPAFCGAATKRALCAMLAGAITHRDDKNPRRRKLRSEE